MYGITEVPDILETTAYILEDNSSFICNISNRLNDFKYLNI